MRGQWLPLSAPRRIVTDLMRFAIAVPSVPVERVMDLSAVIAARDALSNRPAWLGILAKAHALTAREIAPLRRTFVKWPWPHLYEYPTSVAAVTLGRDFGGEPGVVLRMIKDPASLPLAEIGDIIHDAIDRPINEVNDFRRIARLARLPGVLRRPIIWLAFNIARMRANYFGTFTVAGVSLMGADALHLPTWTTSFLTYGIFRPDGRVPVRIFMDHRVFDGVTVANILARLEAILNGPILAELQAQALQAQNPKMGEPQFAQAKAAPAMTRG
jgi:hypothetical protein